MLQIALVDSDPCVRLDDTMRRIGKHDERTCQNKPVSTSSPSSSPISTCQSSLTIGQCYSSNAQMLTSRAQIVETSSASPPPSPHFSYLIRPTTPCIFGREDYDDEQQMNDDEFFLTAGGIVHSCPNIYELSVDHSRRLQSCDHLIVLDPQNALIDHTQLNCYDTELDRYSILPRFQPLSSSVSTDSVNSELELYKERHAVGLYRPYHEHTPAYSSFLPTTWKSDNYLFFMPFIPSAPQSSVFNSLEHGKRSRSHDTSIVA